MNKIKMNLKTFFHLDKGIFKFLHSIISVLTLFIIGWLFVQGLPEIIVTHILPEVEAGSAVTIEQVHAIVFDLYSTFLQIGWTIVALTFIMFIALKFVSFLTTFSPNFFDLLSVIAIMPVVGVISFGSFATVINSLIIIFGLRMIVNIWEYYYKKSEKKRTTMLESSSEI